VLKAARLSCLCILFLGCWIVCLTTWITGARHTVLEALLLIASTRNETSPVTAAAIPGHPGRAKWASLKHDRIGPTRAWPSTKDSGSWRSEARTEPCRPEARTETCSGLTFGSPCQARHDPFGRARVGPMVSLMSSAWHGMTRQK
jgi:hypothetical protein